MCEDYATDVICTLPNQSIEEFIEHWKKKLNPSQVDILRHCAKIEGFELTGIGRDMNTARPRKMLNMYTATFGFNHSISEGEITITFYS